jgi:hypothetical protein
MAEPLLSLGGWNGGSSGPVLFVPVVFRGAVRNDLLQEPRNFPAVNPP